MESSVWGEGGGHSVSILKWCYDENISLVMDILGYRMYAVTIVSLGYVLKGCLLYNVSIFPRFGIENDGILWTGPWAKSLDICDSADNSTSSVHLPNSC